MPAGGRSAARIAGQHRQMGVAMRAHLVVVVSLGLVSACSADWGQVSGESVAFAGPKSLQALPAAMAGVGSVVAAYPDKGRLFAYNQARRTLRTGDAVWHEVNLSEAHALRAAVQGTMVVDAPNGQSIRLQFERKVEHDDGNWSWVGRPQGAKPGVRAVLTFGEQAVFGTIPNGKGYPLKITTAGGRTYLVDTDPRRVTTSEPTESPDFVEAVALRKSVLTSAAAPSTETRASKAAAMAVAPTSTKATPSAADATTIDVVIGFTTAYATRWGGAAGAVTRLNFLVQLTNQAYIDSQVAGRVRMVRALQVDYTDLNSNQSALFALTGVTCTNSTNGPFRLPDTGATCSRVTPNAALRPLHAAREQLGADLVALVRNFNAPEHGSCGISWLNGGQQRSITLANSDFGYAVVSDSGGEQFPDGNTSCREEYLAHELGHTMGQAHDVETAAKANDTNGDGNQLDPEEFGRFPFAFGYSTDATSGNFYTIMSLRRGGQVGELVFSNPRISTCGNNLPCGTANLSDNARALGLTMPVVAGFRMPAFPLPNQFLRGDFDGDGSSDVIWRNRASGANTIWRGANGQQQLAMSPVPDRNWSIVGVGDFNADNRSDVLWRNGVTGQNVLWRSASGSQQQALTALPVDWVAAGIGDFDGDNRDDIFWRNDADGQNRIWRSGSSATPVARPAAPPAWRVVGVGDFDADGKADILWRNQVTGNNTIWRAGNPATQTVLSVVADLAWRPIGVGDFDGDGRADIFWRNGTTGQNTMWRSALRTQTVVLATVSDVRWVPVAVGDFDNDGKDDVLWRNFSTGGNVVWRAATSTLQQARTPVADPLWQISG